MKDDNDLARELESLVRQGYGFGQIMTVAQDTWEKHLRLAGYSGGGVLVVGPCKAMTVPCGCELPHKCPWCNGCGWLTPHVKRTKDAQNPQKTR